MSQEQNDKVEREQMADATAEELVREFEETAKRCGAGSVAFDPGAAYDKADLKNLRAELLRRLASHTAVAESAPVAWIADGNSGPIITPVEAIARQFPNCRALYEGAAPAPSSAGRESTFSDFIRNATPEEKERIYTEVMKRASERQNRTGD